jgi:hypothetical protein
MDPAIQVPSTAGGCDNRTQMSTDRADFRGLVLVMIRAHPLNLRSSAFYEIARIRIERNWLVDETTIFGQGR